MFGPPEPELSSTLLADRLARLQVKLNIGATNRPRDREKPQSHAEKGVLTQAMKEAVMGKDRLRPCGGTFYPRSY
nr:hypothetical protein CFP56_21973 [Quercus suber]